MTAGDQMAEAAAGESVGVETALLDGDQRIQVGQACRAYHRGPDL